jgi:ABC-2 type transport system ATP-binding protein
VHRPQLLFLDEPTTGLDPQTRAGLWNYLERLNKQEGLTIFLTTHYLEEADRLCDRLAIIDHGQIIAMGSPAALKAEIGGDVITLAFAADDARADAQRQAARELVQGLPFLTSVSESDGKLSITAQQGGRALPHVLRVLDEADIYVDDLSLSSPTLDDVFLKYTGERIRQDAPSQNWRNRRGPFMRRRGGPGRR